MGGGGGNAPTHPFLNTPFNEIKLILNKVHNHSQDLVVKMCFLVHSCIIGSSADLHLRRRQQ